MATSLKVTRPNRLTNDETLTSFEDWKNNLKFYLSQDKDFAELLKETATWTKSSDVDVNRGRGDRRSFLKILIFSTDNGRFSAGGAIWPPPIGNRVKSYT